MPTTTRSGNKRANKPEESGDSINKSTDSQPEKIVKVKKPKVAKKTPVESSGNGNIAAPLVNDTVHVPQTNNEEKPAAEEKKQPKRAPKKEKKVEGNVEQPKKVVEKKVVEKKPESVSASEITPKASKNKKKKARKVTAATDEKNDSKISTGTASGEEKVKTPKKVENGEVKVAANKTQSPAVAKSPAAVATTNKVTPKQKKNEKTIAAVSKPEKPESNSLEKPAKSPKAKKGKKGPAAGKSVEDKVQEMNINEKKEVESMVVDENGPVVALKSESVEPTVTETKKKANTRAAASAAAAKMKPAPAPKKNKKAAAPVTATATKKVNSTD